MSSDKKPDIPGVEHLDPNRPGKPDVETFSGGTPPPSPPPPPPPPANQDD